MPRVLAFDAETAPILAHVWGLWDQNISISQIEKVTEMLCFGARWLGEPKSKMIFRSVHHHGKEEMLKTLHELCEEADYIMGWNSRSFDSKHIRREFIENGLPPTSPWRDLDLMVAVKNQFKFPSNKLDYVAQKLGVGAKTQHTGFQLWLDCMAGDDKAWALMKKYQIQDVNLLLDLYPILLPWIPASLQPNFAIESEDLSCTHCGNKNLQRRGYAYKQTGKYQRYQCVGGCGAWATSPKRVQASELRSL